LDTPLNKINVGDLETNFSWENVDGIDFTSPAPDQGHCGSCYLLATNQAMEARIKIWYGVDQRLSVQHRMDCNYMNEGCHGGWGHFDGLFLEQYGAVPETCAPYEGAINTEGCAAHKSCDVVATVADTYYVGSRSYGQMSEDDMLKELRARGPILLDFDAEQSFQMYRGGVLEEPTPVS
jgi:hypothetical protein